ncbi:NnrU family protein [Kiloniella sp. EL199]|uniref:NnrU family protein n=1 Tax=Kiloniella sp. EL199 TaxID=2107581 RepID=UPI000EA34D5E|nr:NnrU family protein [Kiloniella sp. EL199]
MFGGFGGLISSFLVFLLLHSIPPMHRVKQSLINLLGKAGYYILYSLVSTCVLIWLIHEVWAAPYIELWPYEPWAARATAHIMPVSLLFFVMGFLRPNPLSIGPGNGFDKMRMGIVGIVRHPILWGFALWAGAHLFANGGLAEVLFFAGLFLLSVGGMFIVDQRKKRLLGEEAWIEVSSGTSNIPFVGLIKGGNCRPTLKDFLGGIFAVLGFVLALWLHPALFDVSPLSGFL